jgi:hypothetical protein
MVIAKADPAGTGVTFTWPWFPGMFASIVGGGVLPDPKAAGAAAVPTASRRRTPGVR